MLIESLHKVKKSLHRTPMHAMLRRLGVLGLGRSLYNNMIFSRGYHEATVLGHRMKFAVSEQIELVQIDSLFDEDEFISRIIDAVRPNDVVWDVGANIAMVSMLTSISHRGQGVRVHGFEPEPQNLARCRQNVELNGCEGITLHPFGLGRENGKIKLFLEGGVGAGRNTIVAQNGEGWKTMEIDLRKGDDLESSLGAPGVMKIDVEGAEVEVLLGCRSMLERRAIRELFIEVHRDRIFTEGFNEDKVQPWLESLGYRLDWSQERPTAYHHHYRRKEEPKAF